MRHFVDRVLGVDRSGAVVIEGDAARRDVVLAAGPTSERGFAG